MTTGKSKPNAADKMNEGMRPILARVRAGGDGQLDGALEAYFDGGIVLDDDGCLVSVAAAVRAHASRSGFVDDTGYEAYVNKVAVDDWGSERLWDACIDDKVAQALMLADRVGAVAAGLRVGVVCIISVDVHRGIVTFRFHALRGDESAWVQDVNSYQEPLLVRVYPGRGASVS